jgi:hypothetical protein
VKPQKVKAVMLQLKLNRLRSPLRKRSSKR